VRFADRIDAMNSTTTALLLGFLTGLLLLGGSSR
jgi:hypothetical protein